MATLLKDTNKRTRKEKIQKSKFKSQNCKSKVKSYFALLFNFIRQLADGDLSLFFVFEF